jgi:hypothetical protein
MTIRCPRCGEADARHEVARPEYDPVAPQVVGGVVLACIFVLSRKRRFRCDRCGEVFDSHTIGSRIWLGLWIWFWVALVFGILELLVSVGKR